MPLGVLPMATSNRFSMLVSTDIDEVLSSVRRDVHQPRFPNNRGDLKASGPCESQAATEDGKKEEESEYASELGEEYKDEYSESSKEEAKGFQPIASKEPSSSAHKVFVEMTKPRLANDGVGVDGDEAREDELCDGEESSQSEGSSSEDVLSCEASGFEQEPEPATVRPAYQTFDALSKL
ncbi:hypothetical protein U1Q18_025687 [Sarracenia purpurea var. burkii]